MTERVLSGRYELEERIGSGGMAEVYRAQDRLLDRTVAVKILHAAYKNDVEFIERFQREAKAAAGLSHPNIVSIFDVGLEGDDHFIVMEYVPGATLKQKIQSEAPIDISLAVRIAKDIASGLAHAHANNIVHCDIKPHNILITEDNRAKIADFGIARAVTESTMTYSGSVVGSVHYFSPEQARGSMITPKSDVYSLGITLYEMLTGKLPFNGDNPVSIAMKHVEEEALPPTSLRRNIPPMLEAVVLRAMNKNPDVRPTSAELVQELAMVEKTFGMTKTIDPDATQVLPRAESNLPPRRAERRKAATPQKGEKKSFFRSKIFTAGLLTVLLLGFGIGSFLAFGNFFNQEEVLVPDVTGKQLALARQILEDGNLRVNVAETYDANVPPGQVVKQDPDSGKAVRTARLVTIYISKGGEEIDMPDLQGLAKSAATEVLQKAGLTVGSIYEKYSDEEPGTVLMQDPAVGTKINRGTAIDLTVSKGDGSSTPVMKSSGSSKSDTQSRTPPPPEVTSQPSQPIAEERTVESPSVTTSEPVRDVEPTYNEPPSTEPITYNPEPVSYEEPTPTAVEPEPEPEPESTPVETTESFDAPTRESGGVKSR